MVPAVDGAIPNIGLKDSPVRRVVAALNVLADPELAIFGSCYSYVSIGTDYIFSSQSERSALRLKGFSPTRTFTEPYFYCGISPPKE